MASESADQSLSPDVTSFVIAEKTWKLDDQIHSTGITVELGPLKTKMGHTFCDALATARAEGVFMGRVPVRNIV